MNITVRKRRRNRRAILERPSRKFWINITVRKRRRNRCAILEKRGKTLFISFSCKRVEICAGETNAFFDK